MQVLHISNVYNEFGQTEYLRVEHDFAQQHILQRCDGLGAIDGIITLESLIEI